MRLQLLPYAKHELDAPTRMYDMYHTIYHLMVVTPKGCPRIHYNPEQGSCFLDGISWMTLGKNEQGLTQTLSSRTLQQIVNSCADYNSLTT